MKKRGSTWTPAPISESKSDDYCLRAGVTMHMSKSKGKPYYRLPNGRTVWEKPLATFQVNPRLCETWDEVLRTIYGPRSNAFGESDVLWNTLAYFFWHMRSAIYVNISNGKVLTIAPFANRNYTNNWSSNIPLREGADRFDKMRAGFLSDKRKWWSNGGTVSTLLDPKKPAWGSFFLREISEMAHFLAPHLGHAEFFVNKRDHPVVRSDLSESYAMLFFGKHDVREPSNVWTDFIRGHFSHFSPVYSFYSSRAFEDKHFPLPADWQLSRQQLNNRRRVEWNAKQEIAMWRGSATGYSVSASENPRLQVVQLSSKLVDAKLTSWNRRMKVQSDKSIAVINDKDYPFPANKSFFIPSEQWGKFKYLLYIDGNVGASRFGRLLSTGSLVIVVRSELPQPWLFQYAKDGEHYLGVDSVSDLPSTVQWCIAHDEECRVIAERGVQLVSSMKQLMIDHMMNSA
ncbi:MAG: hypothetical protein CMD33_03920 [Flavobacteriales bacterium]|nr:hypothetical protein [Flavobacteriales bacterium]